MAFFCKFLVISNLHNIFKEYITLTVQFVMITAVFLKSQYFISMFFDIVRLIIGDGILK